MLSGRTESSFRIGCRTASSRRTWLSSNTRSPRPRGTTPTWRARSDSQGPRTTADCCPLTCDSSAPATRKSKAPTARCWTCSSSTSSKSGKYRRATPLCGRGASRLSLECPITTTWRALSTQELCSQANLWGSTLCPTSPNTQSSTKTKSSKAFRSVRPTSGKCSSYLRTRKSNGAPASPTPRPSSSSTSTGPEEPTWRWTPTSPPFSPSQAPSPRTVSCRLSEGWGNSEEIKKLLSSFPDKLFRKSRPTTITKNKWIHNKK